MTRTLSFRFTFEKDWRAAPVAFWIHSPVPEAVPHKGFVFLRIEVDEHELQFSAPAQLDHVIEVLSSKPLPTSRQLASRHSCSVGLNGHWLSRLPASLKSPRKRGKLVQLLCSVRSQVGGSGTDWTFQATTSGGL